MKTCIFIIGTNCTGKSSLAKAIAEGFGGYRAISRELTVCADQRVCLAGSYSPDKRFGGVDGLNETKGLQQIVHTALVGHECIVCEGIKLHNNGPNLTRAIFTADNRLVVFLYAPAATLHRRLLERNSSGKGVTEAILKDQQACARSLERWRGMGIPVMWFDTSKTSVEVASTSLINYIKNAIRQ